MATNASFIPNGSFFYNLQTKRLHNAILDQGGAAIAPGTEFGTLTFNLVLRKVHFWSSWFGVNPGTPNHNVLLFPTRETTDFLMNEIKTRFAKFGLIFTVSGNVDHPETPSETSDAVTLKVENPNTGNSENFGLGYVAQNVMAHGVDYALDVMFKLELVSAGLIS